MAVLESVQFKVGLTKNKDVLKQLRVNRMWRRDERGDYLSIQFDGQEFKFRPGVTFTVGKTVGNALIRSSAVIVGDDPLSDPILPYVEKINEFALGDEDKSSTTSNSSKFVCPFPECGKDMETAPRLARHMMKAHKDEVGDDDEDVKAVAASAKPKNKIDWDTPLEEQVGKRGDHADGDDEVQTVAEKE